MPDFFLDGSEIVKTLEVSPTSSLHSATDILREFSPRTAPAEGFFFEVFFFVTMWHLPFERHPETQ